MALQILQHPPEEETSEKSAASPAHWTSFHLELEVKKQALVKENKCVGIFIYEYINTQIYTWARIQNFHHTA